jgi:imidazolonepropionase-like amidohydrolase
MSMTDRRPFAFLVAAVLFFATPALAVVTAFEGGRIIVGDGTVIEDGTLVMDDDKIIAVGDIAYVSVPGAAMRVGITGKTIMPTLIDAHVHLGRTPEAIAGDLRRRAIYGVGATQSMGSDPYELLPLRSRVMPGMARYFSAGRGITAPEEGRSTIPHWITTADQGRAAVRELAAQKVDIIKIWVDDRNGQYKKLTPEQYGAIIDEANKVGLRVSAHIVKLEDAKGLLRANLHSFAHSIRDVDADAEVIALFKQHPNIVLIPTLPARGARTDLSFLRGTMSAEAFAKVEAENVDKPELQKIHAIQSRNLKKMNDAGVKIVLGTDGNTPWGPHLAMEDMVLAGMTPMQVIVAATSRGAEFIRMNDAGVLAPGKSADFILLDANPLENIVNSRRINTVYLRGAEVPRPKF